MKDRFMASVMKIVEEKRVRVSMEIDKISNGELGYLNPKSHRRGCRRSEIRKLFNREF